MKRKVSLLLAFIMLFSILPATAFAAGADGQLMALNENAESTDIPQTPTLVSKTANSLTVENRDENGDLETGVEWMLCNMYDEPITGWVQGENSQVTFDGLTDGTRYFIYARYAENDNQFASPAGAALEAQTEPAPLNIEVLVKCGDKLLVPADFKVYEGDKFFDWALTGGEEATITVKLSDDANAIYKPNTFSLEADGITAVKGTCANGEYNATIRLNDYTKGGTVTFNLTEKETLEIRVCKGQARFEDMKKYLTDTKEYDGKAAEYGELNLSDGKWDDAFFAQSGMIYTIKNNTRDVHPISITSYWVDAQGNRLTGSNRDPINAGTYRLIAKYDGSDKYKPVAETVLITLTITPIKMKDPVAPMIDTVTKDSISYAGEQGQKYIVTTSETAPAANDADWKECAANGPMTETDLKPNTQYYIHTFVPALNGNYVDSETVSVPVTTKHSYGLEVADNTTLTWTVIVGTDVKKLSAMKKYLPLKSTGTGAVVVEKTNYSDGLCGGTLAMTISPNDPEKLWEFFPHKSKVDTSKAGTVEYTYKFKATKNDAPYDLVKEFTVKCVVNVVEKHDVSFTNFDDLTVTYGDTYDMETAVPQVQTGVAAYNGELEYYYTDANGVTSTGAPVMAGTYTVMVKVPDNNANYRGQATAKLIIEPKEVELTGLAVKEKIYDGTTAAELDETGAALSGVLPVDEALVNFNVISAAFNSENVTEANVVTIEAQLEGSHKNNYKLKAPAPIAAAITPREVSIAVTAKDKVYDGTIDAEVTAAYAENSGMLDADVPFVTLKAENGTFTDKNAGENKVVTCTVTMVNNGSFTTASNYTLKYADAAASISPKEVYVTFEGTMEHVYDGQPKQVTANLEGILENDTASVAVVYGTDTAAPSLAGDYLLTAKDLSNSNYKLADDPYTQEAASRTLKISLGEYTPGSSSAEKSIGYLDTEEKSYDLSEIFGIDIPGTFEIFLLEENEILAKHALTSGRAAVQLKAGCSIGETAAITYVFTPAAANTHKSFTVTLLIKVAEEVVTRTEVLGAPDEVTIGTELDYSGITLQVTFQNGQTVTFDNTQYTSSGYSAALMEENLGTQTLTLTANANGTQYTAAKDINVKDMLTGLALESAPAKTEYAIGETALDLTGGKVKASYKSGAEKSMELSDPALTLSEVTEAMMRTLGEYEVTVSYTEETSAETSFKFTVVAGAKENPAAGETGGTIKEDDTFLTDPEDKTSAIPGSSVDLIIGQAKDPEAAKEAVEKKNAAFKDKMLPFNAKLVDENGNAVYSNKPVPVQLAYPAGTNSKSGFTLYIVQDDGELKTVKLTKKESHLVFHLPKGFSEADLVLAWKKSGSGTPETGDTASLALWLGLALLSLAGIAVTGIARRKLKREN